MANRFMLNETSYHGKGAIDAIPEEIKNRGFKKVFLASDPDLVKFEVTKKVSDKLEAAGIPYELYSNIKPNPTIENVQTGVKAFKDCGADWIVAVGGGSSMDTSKAIGIIIANPEFEDVRSLEGVDDMSQEEYRKAACDAVKQLASDVGIECTLKGIVPEEDLDSLTNDALKDACAPGNPKDANFDDVKNMFLSLMK